MNNIELRLESERKWREETALRGNYRKEKRTFNHLICEMVNNFSFLSTKKKQYVEETITTSGEPSLEMKAINETTNGLFQTKKIKLSKGKKLAQY